MSPWRRCGAGRRTRLLQTVAKDAAGPKHAFAPRPRRGRASDVREHKLVSQANTRKRSTSTPCGRRARWGWCHFGVQIWSPGASHAPPSLDGTPRRLHHARINQPIGEARNNAHAALRFLAREPSDLAEVREVLDGAIKETYRAGDILGEIREQINTNCHPPSVPDLPEAIEEAN
jgi:hypothetical protein